MQLKRFILFFLLATFSTGAVLTGCSNDSDITGDGGGNSDGGDDDNVLRLNLHDEPTVFDPGTQEDYVSGIISMQMFDGLMRTGEDGEPEKSLAEDIDISDDELTYTFTLRDAEWSNGDPVTAGDFEYAWKRVLDPDTGSNDANELYFIENAEDYYKGDADEDEVGVKALDDDTLEVTLESPTEYFLEYATTPTLGPLNEDAIEEAGEDEEWANDPDTAVVNGPFKLASYEPQNELILEKNEDYWDADSVKMDKIEFSIVDEANTELGMFDQGELDWAGLPVGELPRDAIQSLQDDDDLHSEVMARSAYVRFNTEKEPFTNEKIRKAFAYAINREEIASSATYDTAEPLMGYIPKTMALKEDGYFDDNNVDEAKELLEEGMEELGISELPEVTFLYNTSSENKKVAQILQAQLNEALDVDVKLEHEESKVFFEDQNNMKFDFSISGLTGSYNDPIGFLKNYEEADTNVNNTMWENEEYNEYLDQARHETDTDKRDEYLEKAEALMMDEMPLFGLYTASNYWVQNEDVKGYRIDPTGHIDYKWVSKE